MASSDEDNADRLYKEATESRENFNIMMSIFVRQNRLHDQFIEPIVLPPPVQPSDAVQTPTHVQAPAPVQAQPAAQPTVPVQVETPSVNTRPLSRQQLENLNAMESRARRQAIDALGLNAADRKSLVNRLWRLRHPDEVRQNSRRSYQNRRNLNT